MAKNYSEIFKSVYTDGNSMSFGNAMLRGNGVPLDITEVYDSFAAAVEYAARNPVAYEGQLLSVTENGDTTVYVITPAVQGTYFIDPDKDGSSEEVNVYLKEVGSLPEADGKTIEVVDGVLRLVGLEDLDASKTYQPVLVNGKIEWQVPSATTVEGLDGRLTVAEGKVTALEQAVGNAEAGLVKDVADLGTAISDLEGEVADVAANAKSDDEALHTAITSEIETAVAAALAEAKQYADDNDADTVYDDTAIQATVSEHTTAIASVKETADKAAADIKTESEARATAISGLETSLKAHVAEQIGNQAHFSAKVVASEDEMTDATTLYLMKTAETGDDLYEEWMLIGGVATKIGTTATDLTDYATTEAVATAIKTAVDTAVADMSAEIGALEDVHAKDAADLQKAVEDVAGDLADFQTAVGTTYETIENVESKRAALQDSIDAVAADVAKKADAEDTSAAIKAAEEKADAAQGTADANATAIEGLQGTSDDHEERIADLEAVGAEKNVIASVSTEFNIAENRELQIASVAQDKVTGLTADLAALREGKVDTKFTNIDGQQVAWTLLSPENQDKLAALTIGDGGNIELSGKVNAENVEGLASYITAYRDSISGLLSSTAETKLSGIAEGAQVNVLEGIKIAGAKLEVGADKHVNIPFATNDTIGVVLSSTAENKISVGADGTMEVNSLNVNKLVQTEGETLILNGGSSL